VAYRTRHVDLFTETNGDQIDTLVRVQARSTKIYRVRVRVFNATFNNISAISWRSVLLVDETGENHRPAISYFIT